MMLLSLSIAEARWAQKDISILEQESSLLTVSGRYIQTWPWLETAVVIHAQAELLTHYYKCAYM